MPTLLQADCLFWCNIPEMYMNSFDPLMLLVYWALIMFLVLLMTSSY